MASCDGSGETYDVSTCRRFLGSVTESPNLSLDLSRKVKSQYFPRGLGLRLGSQSKIT